jgi:hypothetical protein
MAQKKRKPPASARGSKQNPKPRWWEASFTRLLVFGGAVALAAGGAIGGSLGSSTWQAAVNLVKGNSSVTEVNGSLQFSLRDTSENLGDLSYAADGIVTPQAGLTSAVKVGTRQITMTITNNYSRDVEISGITLTDVMTLPPVTGTLFSQGAQGVTQDAQMGVELDQHPPILRHMTVAYRLGDPYFGDSSITIPADSEQVVVITVFAGAAKAYKWRFLVYYDAGHAEQRATITAPRDVLSITGYARTYGRVYLAEGSSWLKRRPVQYCVTTGTYCFSANG